MPQIINLDELVPEAIEFVYQKETYLLPGDIDTETTFKLEQLLIETTNTEVDLLLAQGVLLAAAKPAAITKARKLFNDAKSRQVAATLKTEAEVLALFKVNHPDLEKLPFGAAGLKVVLAHLLVKLGFATPGDEEDDEAEADADPKATPGKSRRSSSSQRS